mmetsp:Transcript_57690/g.135161  ORF Transcript_57690/g.135161 Transcript_57690/m.135161 type:complete len:215 (+) Transcript_57690:521-1165(+)
MLGKMFFRNSDASAPARVQKHREVQLSCHIQDDLAYLLWIFVHHAPEARIEGFRVVGQELQKRCGWSPMLRLVPLSEACDHSVLRPAFRPGKETLTDRILHWHLLKHECSESGGVQVQKLKLVLCHRATVAQNGLADVDLVCQEISQAIPPNGAWISETDVRLGVDRVNHAGNGAKHLHPLPIFKGREDGIDALAVEDDEIRPEVVDSSMLISN